MKSGEPIYSCQVLKKLFGEILRTAIILYIQMYNLTKIGMFYKFSQYCNNSDYGR